MATEAPPAPTAAPAAPAPSQQPASATGKPNLTSAFDTLDNIVKGPDTEPKVTPTTTTQKRDIPETPKPNDPPPKPDTDPKPGDPSKPPKAASLREALDLSKRGEAEWKSKYEALKKEHETPRDDPEKKTLSEKLTAAEKRRQEIEDELKFARYESTTEYKEKYEAPFVNAYAAGRKRAESITIREPDTKDALDQVIPGKARKGTADDFENLMGISDDDQAWEFAKQTFGDKAGLIWNNRERVIEANNARMQAVEEYRKNGLEREKSSREMSEKQTTEFKGLFDTAIKSAIENPQYAEWFKPVEGDTKGAELLTKGFEVADSAFSDTSKLTPQERANLYAAVRNRAGAFSYMNHMLKKAKAEAADLKTKLEEYENSEPNLDGKGARKTGVAPKAGGTGMSEVDAWLEKAAGVA